MSELKELCENTKVGQNWKNHASRLIGKMAIRGITRAESRVAKNEMHLAHVNKIIADTDDTIAKLDKQIAGLQKARDGFAEDKNRISVKYDLRINAISKSDMSATTTAIATMRGIINKDPKNPNPKWVGVIADLNGTGTLEYSKNANNFYLNTKWNGKESVVNGNVIYQDWINNNFAHRKEFFDNVIKDSDWRLAGIVAAPAANLDGKTDTYAKTIKAPKFGESDVAVVMYYLYNIKTGEVVQLMDDENSWLSLGHWGTRPDCAQDALDNAACDLGTYCDLWRTVRGLVVQRVKQLDARGW